MPRTRIVLSCWAVSLAGVVACSEGDVVLVQVQCQPARHLAHTDAAEAHGGVEVVRRLGAEPLLHLRQQLGDAGAEAFQLALHHLLAAQHVLLAFLALEPLPHLGAGVACLYITCVGVQPVPRWTPRRAAGHDFDHVAVLQLVGQRHQAAVNPRADGVVADVGVDPEGEVDRRRAGGQVFHLALGGEHEDLVAEQVRLDVLDELLRLGRLALPLQQLTQPRDPLLERRRRAGRLPCNASAPRRRTRLCGASRRFGSAPPAGARRGPSPSCAATGRCSRAGWRCSRRTGPAAAATCRARCPARGSSPPAYAPGRGSPAGRRCR